MAVTTDLEAAPGLIEVTAQLADQIAAEAIVDGDLATWVAWRPEQVGTVARAGVPGVYDGDAGIAWALAQLALVLDSEELAGLARAGIRHALTRTGTEPGLLVGAPGVAVAAHQIGTVIGDVTLIRDAHYLLADTAAPVGWDVTAGWAGHLLAQVACYTSSAAVAETAGTLAAGARRHETMACWPEPDPASSRAGGGMCGLAHGNAGVVWALGETAQRDHTVRAAVLPLIAEGMRWEQAWFDARTCSWPDLRPDSVGSMAAWCQGAVGVGMSRLRLLQLGRDGGVDLSVPGLIAEIEAALQGTLAVAERTLDLALCHGAAGRWGMLHLAGQVLGEQAHSKVARELAATDLRRAGDPLSWASGYPGLPVSSGLFTGYAGIALTLAALWDERVVQPSLFGVRLA